MYSQCQQIQTTRLRLTLVTQRLTQRRENDINAALHPPLRVTAQWGWRILIPSTNKQEHQNWEPRGPPLAQQAVVPPTAAASSNQ
jgi:hypothetical protein